MNRCRHFRGLFPDDRPACAKGRDVRAWARRCNGGSDLGIGLRLPCTKRPDDGEKALFDCPELCRETDAEISERRAALSARMHRVLLVLPKLNAIKNEMVSKGIPTSIADCPWCESVDGLSVNVAIGANNHMRAKCRDCGEGVLE